MKTKFFIITKSQLTNIGLLRYCLVEKSKFNKHGYKGILKYVQHTVYSKGILQSSRVETYKNGNLNSSSLLKHQNKSYLLIADGDTTTINDSIEYSGSLIYFNEPTGIKKITTNEIND